MRIPTKSGEFTREGGNPDRPIGIPGAIWAKMHAHRPYSLDVASDRLAVLSYFTILAPYRFFHILPFTGLAPLPLLPVYTLLAPLLVLTCRHYNTAKRLNHFTALTIFSALNRRSYKSIDEPNRPAMRPRFNGGMDRLRAGRCVCFDEVRIICQFYHFSPPTGFTALLILSVCAHYRFAIFTILPPHGP